MELCTYFKCGKLKVKHYLLVSNTEYAITVDCCIHCNENETEGFVEYEA